MFARNADQYYRQADLSLLVTIPALMRVCVWKSRFISDRQFQAEPDGDYILVAAMENALVIRKRLTPPAVRSHGGRSKVTSVGRTSMVGVDG